MSWRGILVMMMLGTLGLGFPDIDQAALPLLHHRSILTHSVLLPLPFLLVRSEAVRAGAAGFLLGVSVHLAADVLSPPHGYGAVWLPWPMKASLGPLSPLWLMINAGVGLVCAFNALNGLALRYSTGIFGLLSLALAGAYATLHEKKGMAFIAFVMIFGLSFAISAWASRRRSLSPNAAPDPAPPSREPGPS